MVTGSPYLFPKKKKKRLGFLNIRKHFKHYIIEKLECASGSWGLGFKRRQYNMTNVEIQRKSLLIQAHYHISGWLAVLPWKNIILISLQYQPSKQGKQIKSNIRPSHRKKIKLRCQAKVSAHMDYEKHIHTSKLKEWTQRHKEQWKQDLIVVLQYPVSDRQAHLGQLQPVIYLLA